MADTAPDAITLLKDDHRKVEALFKQFKEAKGSATKKKVAEQISVALRRATTQEIPGSGYRGTSPAGTGKPA